MKGGASAQPSEGGELTVVALVIDYDEDSRTVEGGGVFEVNVPAGATVAQTKVAIERASGISAGNQSLIFGGRALIDGAGKLAGDYGFKSGDRLAVVRRRGLKAPTELTERRLQHLARIAPSDKVDAERAAARTAETAATTKEIRDKYAARQNAGVPPLTWEQVAALK